MWTAGDIEGGFKDHPCNTHITLRIVEGRLNMLVMNRSNDLIWGMMGSNIVCFTMLQEYLAGQIGCPVGTYSVVTANLHVYPEMPRYAEIMNEATINHPALRCESMRGLSHTIRRESLAFIKGYVPRNSWFRDVAEPMHRAYVTKTWRLRLSYAMLIECPAWREAATRWLLRREPK
jgi:thymidylate synthase